MIIHVEGVLRRQKLLVGSMERGGLSVVVISRLHNVAKKTLRRQTNKS
jgi:hypothetical protein